MVFRVGVRARVELRQVDIGICIVEQRAIRGRRETCMVAQLLCGLTDIGAEQVDPPGSILCMGPPSSSAAVLPIARLGRALLSSLPRARGARRFSARRAALQNARRPACPACPSCAPWRTTVPCSSCAPRRAAPSEPAAPVAHGSVASAARLSRGASYSCSPEVRFRRWPLRSSPPCCHEVKHLLALALWQHTEMKSPPGLRLKLPATLLLGDHELHHEAPHACHRQIRFLLEQQLLRHCPRRQRRPF
ncbi:unnamed protein product [Closterium sp. NIES-54]